MAREFNGSSNFIQIGTDPALYLPIDQWSVGGWLRIDSDPGSTSRRVFEWFKSVTGDSSAYRLFRMAYFSESDAVYPNKLFLLYTTVTGNQVRLATDGSPVANRNWQHLMVRRLGANFRIYIDGTAVANLDHGESLEMAVDTSFYLGNGSSGSYYIHGGLAEWAKWDRALSDAEIAALTAGANPARFSHSLMWHWPMREDLRERQANLTVTNSGTILSEHPRIELPPQNGIIQPVIQRALGV